MAVMTLTMATVWRCSTLVLSEEGIFEVECGIHVPYVDDGDEGGGTWMLVRDHLITFHDIPKDLLDEFVRPDMIPTFGAPVGAGVWKRR